MHDVIAVDVAEIRDKKHWAVGILCVVSPQHSDLPDFLEGFPVIDEVRGSTCCGCEGCQRWQAKIARESLWQN